MAEQLYGVPEQFVQRVVVADVDIRQDMHPLLRPRVAGAAQLLDDFVARFLQFALAAGAEQHPRPGNRQVAAQLQADAETAAGDNRGLAFVQPREHAHDRRGHGGLAGGALDALRDPQVDGVHLAHPVGQGRRPVR